MTLGHLYLEFLSCPCLARLYILYTSQYFFSFQIATHNIYSILRYSLMKIRYGSCQLIHGKVLTAQFYNLQDINVSFAQWYLRTVCVWFFNLEEYMIFFSGKWNFQVSTMNVPSQWGLTSDALQGHTDIDLDLG